MLLAPAVKCMHEQMAEPLVVHPAFKKIYGILYKTPKEKLLSLQVKLNRMSTESAKLLQIMICNTLQQEDRAWVPLTTLGRDQIAPPISNSVAPHQDPAVLIKVARIYTLLVKENFCGESDRNRAYELAIEASRSGDKVSLCNLLSESLQACGDHSFNSATLDAPLTLKSIPNDTTASSSPILIPGNRRNDISSVATTLESLHPYSSVAFSSSNLEISQSPTAAFVSGNAQRNHIEPSKLCHDIQSGPVQYRREGEDDLGVQNVKEAGQEPSMPSAYMQPLSKECEGSFSHPSTSSGSETSARLPASNRFPEECIATSSTSPCVMPTDEPKKAKGPRTDMTSVEILSSTGNAPSSPSSTVPPAEDIAALRYNIDSSATPVLTETAGSERTFFSFVILHVKEDEAIALKVRDTLKTCGIPDGTTYCEEFEIPGHSPITCIEDAVDNSAFTILLLTSRFVSHWARLQTNAVLMNSIKKKHKFNSVIPFLPKEDPLKEIPMVLNSITPLEEKSSVFSLVVQKTFKKEKIQKKKEFWKKEEEVRELKKRNEETKEQVQHCQKKNAAMLELLQCWKLLQLMSHNPGPQQPFPTAEAAGGFPSFPPQMADIAHLLNGLSDAQGIQYPSGGTQPVIQIQHARNIQIGDNNQMRIVQTEEEKDSLNETDSESDGVS